MKKIFFEKMHGAGNDFIVIDKGENSSFVLSKNDVKVLCRRRTGIGSDGLITISKSDKYDFEMAYFNADGSGGSLCGNGARCAIYFANKKNIVHTTKVKFLSNGIEYSGEVLENEKVKFNFNKPKIIKKNIEINATDLIIKASYADTGSPHVVIKIEDILKDNSNKNSFYKNINEVPVNKLGRVIRYHKDFEPEGANVNFIQIKENKVLIRTYERGVENETLACGTGSVAAAIISFLLYDLSLPIKLITKGEDELIIDFKLEDNNQINNISLTGPVKFVYSGSVVLNNLL